MTTIMIANARVWNAVVFPSAMAYPTNRALQPRSLARAFHAETTSDNQG